MQPHAVLTAVTQFTAHSLDVLLSLGLVFPANLVGFLFWSSRRRFDATGRRRNLRSVEICTRTDRSPLSLPLPIFSVHRHSVWLALHHSALSTLVQAAQFYTQYVFLCTRSLTSASVMASYVVSALQPLSVKVCSSFVSLLTVRMFNWPFAPITVCSIIFLVWVKGKRR